MREMQSYNVIQRCDMRDIAISCNARLSGSDVSDMMQVCMRGPPAPCWLWHRP